MKVQGGFLQLLAGLASQSLSFFTGIDLPALGVGALYIYYEIVHKVHNKKKMKKRQGKNKHTK